MTRDTEPRELAASVVYLWVAWSKPLRSWHLIEVPRQRSVSTAAKEPLPSDPFHCSCRPGLLGWVLSHPGWPPGHEGADWVTSWEWVPNLTASSTFCKEGQGWLNWYLEDMRDSIESLACETLTCVPAHTDHLIPVVDQVLGSLIRTIPTDPSKIGLLYVHPLIKKSPLKRTMKKTESREHQNVVWLTLLISWGNLDDGRHATQKAKSSSEVVE